MTKPSLLKRKALREFLTFCGVGIVGFVVDAGLIQLLSGILSWNPYLARIPTYVCAATVTWGLNRSLTFRHARAADWQAQWFRYLIVSAVGAGVNYLAFAGTLLASQTVRSYPAMAVAVGSIVGLMFNFTLSKTVVFKPAGAAHWKREL